MRYQRSIHCSLLGRPRDILVVDDVVFVSSYDHDSIFVLDRGTFELIGAIRQPHMVHPRGLYAHNGRLYAACYGNPMGKVVVMSLSTFQEVSHFPVPRPRGLVVVRDRVHVTEVMQNRIGVYRKTGECDAVLGQGMLCRPRGLTHDATKLYVADSGADRIVAMTFSGTLVFAVGGIYHINDVACYAGRLYATEWYEKRVVCVWGKRVQTRAAVRGGSGNLAMLTVSDHRLVLVSDDTRGCIHIFEN